jgi:hypothetical protein
VAELAGKHVVPLVHEWSSLRSGCAPVNLVETLG